MWAAERPEDAEDVQRLAVAAAANCVAEGELAAAAHVVAAGLEASMLGAPSGAERLVSATWLALLGARIAFELDDSAGSRVLVDGARDTADLRVVTGPLDGYLRLHRHLIEARLAEAALEWRAAREGYLAAADLAAALADGRQARDLLTPWSDLMFGPIAQSRPDAAALLLRKDVGEVGLLAVLGLARTSSELGPARDAIDRCVTEGLPLNESVLALWGVLDRLPAEEIDSAGDRLCAVADGLDEPWRASWLLAVRALQADAWLARSELDRAKNANDLAHQVDPARADGLAFMLGFASWARERYMADDAGAAWSATELLLRLRADTASQLAGSRLELRARAACEPALAAAVKDEAGRIGDEDDPESRRRAAALIDALRSAEDAPPTDVGLPDSDSSLERAEWLAADRIGRLAYQVSQVGQAGDVMVLVVQSVGDAMFFVAVGADEDNPVVTTASSADARQGLTNLAAAAEQATLTPARDVRLKALGRAAFDAMPAQVRARLLRASTVVIVPDLGAGRDRTPFELLHDGETFLGVSKVMCRCLSLSHALRVLEPSVVPPTPGRRALCVAVAAPPGLPPLSYAASEASLVKGALGGGWDAETLLESSAEPDVILELAPLADVLHLACHGDSAAGAEALVLGNGTRLRAFDIATRHRLRGITYLNACSLGRGRYVGGGLSRGVAYAFARAGSPTVVANLLPVADQSAADLAEAFYVGARDHPVGEALRRARESLNGRISAALWSTTVLVGDPFRRLDGTRDLPPDETGRLFAGEPEPSPERLELATATVRSNPRDIRLAAAVELSMALADGEPRLDAAARVAHELGHDVGEAHCLLVFAEAALKTGDLTRHERAVRAAVAALEPLRGVWSQAYDAHRDAVAELRSLDPTYKPRELQSFRFESGLTVNDRTDPAVDALIRLQEAQFEHESFWRGEPVLTVPDVDVTSVAHNAVVWGYIHRLYGTGAESAYALASAERLAWRGLLAEGAISYLHRIWAGLLCFAWGQQYVTHLQESMLRAHTRVLEIAVARVGRLWVPAETSLALPFVREIGTVLDGLETPPQSGSRFARARAALHSDTLAAPDVDEILTKVQEAVGRCQAVDAFAAADLGAWVIGDVLERERLAAADPEPRQGTVLAFRTLFERLATYQEGWIMPYLTEGFAGERDTGGMDILGRWSSQVL